LIGQQAILLERGPWTTVSDEEVIARVRAGEIELYEIIMRRHNQRLYRVARSILRDSNEAEDVMQEAYVRAYEHLDQFAGESKFATWLTRIAVHEALRRARRHHRFQEMAPGEREGQNMDAFKTTSPDPEQQAQRRELETLLETAIETLPLTYRTVFVLREIEGLSTTETAESLGLREETVKTRLFRSRALLRRELFARAGALSSRAFQFQAPRCDRVVANVLARIQGAATN
jgi:RNA polymerase sigma-70 factor (ECF subfamily)